MLGGCKYECFSHRRAGYIASHTNLQLLDVGYNVVVVDDLSNSSKESIRRVEKLAGKEISFYEGDILDKDL